MAESAREYVAVVQKAQAVLGYIRQEKYEHALLLAEGVVRELKELTGADKVPHLDASGISEGEVIKVTIRIREHYGHLGLMEAKELVEAARHRPVVIRRSLDDAPPALEDVQRSLELIGARILLK